MSYLNLPKLSIKTFILPIILGIIVAFIIYQAQIRGLFPFIDRSAIKDGMKIQTLVKEENAVISVIEKASPAVVSISLEGDKKNSIKKGIGFIADSKGIIISDKNTVSELGQYIVATADGQKFEVRSVYRNPALELSLLIIDANNLKALELGDSSLLKLGQTVIALGQSKQAVNVSAGVVSGLSDFIQTDAVINIDNLGGPLLSASGQVVGVNLKSAGSQGFGLAVPINSVKQLIASVKENSFKPILGLTYKFIPIGAFVQEVTPGGSADRAGIKVEDVIVKINGREVDTENIVSDVIANSRIGQQVEIILLRSGKELIIKAILSAKANP